MFKKYMYLILLNFSCYKTLDVRNDCKLYSGAKWMKMDPIKL